MWAIKALPAALAVIAYIYFYYTGGHLLRLTFSITATLVAIFVLVNYFMAICRHTKLKAYFWKNLNVTDKSVVNYGFHRPVVDLEERITRFHLLFCWYWKKEIEFQKKRNKVIKEYNEQKGNELIFLEQKLNRLGILNPLLIGLVITSFSHC